MSKGEAMVVRTQVGSGDGESLPWEMYPGGRIELAGGLDPRLLPRQKTDSPAPQ